MYICIILYVYIIHVLNYLYIPKLYMYIIECLKRMKKCFECKEPLKLYTPKSLLEDFEGKCKIHTCV